MYIEIRYVDGCPHVQTARERLAAALAATGLVGARVRQRLVPDDHEADVLQFTGSPTILIEGVDPFADPDAQVGLCCRLYGTARGLEPAPTIEQLIGALTIAPESAPAARSQG
ncbi:MULTISPECIES: thioredoxin family protein [unclassified Mycobacterium]|uniref:thioredoxin family protein n=1 Tax=unclassified Mycobacterium TaxID=2642494 RepID=UPI0029C71952|nr:MULTISPECIES: thioredoxin family protein [unclassified Mycobacterium]